MKPVHLLLLVLPPAALTAAAAALGAGGAALHAVAAIDAAYVVLVVLARIRRAWPPASDALVASPSPARPAASVPALEQIDSALLFSRTSRLDFERHLRPMLFAVALSRLRRRGIDSARQPEQAERLLGRRVWEVVTPPDVRPERDVPGVSLEEIEAIVSALEEV